MPLPYTHKTICIFCTLWYSKYCKHLLPQQLPILSNSTSTVKMTFQGVILTIHRVGGNLNSAQFTDSSAGMSTNIMNYNTLGDVKINWLLQDLWTPSLIASMGGYTRLSSSWNWSATIWRNMTGRSTS